MSKNIPAARTQLKTTGALLLGSGQLSIQLEYLLQRVENLEIPVKNGPWNGKIELRLVKKQLTRKIIYIYK